MTVEGPAEDDGLEDRADACLVYIEEDRDIVIFPLVEMFRGLDTLVCELQLRPGKNLNDLVDLAVLMARYCILVVSPRMLMRSFPPGELDGVASRQSEGEHIVLPLWYRVNDSQVRARSAVLADLPGARWSDGVSAATTLLWTRVFPRVPKSRTEPVVALAPVTSVAEVLGVLRNVSARRMAFDDLTDDIDHTLVKGLRALLEMWIIAADSGDAAAEAVMVEAFRMVFDDLNGSTCRIFAGRIEHMDPDADAREMRPLGMIVVGRMDAAGADLIGDWVTVNRSPTPMLPKTKTPHLTRI
jgi:hypothetical protein